LLVLQPSDEKIDYTLKRKKKRPQDSAWHPKAHRKPRHTTIAKSPSAQSKFMLKLMQALNSPVPADKIRVVYDGKSPLTTKTFQLIQDDTLSPLKTTLITPKGSHLHCSEQMTMNQSQWRIFLPASKVLKDAIHLPKVAAKSIDSSPIPQASFEGLPEICISKQRIIQIQNLKATRQEQGKNPRLIGQNALMGISARNALKLAGIEVPPHSVHYTHLLPWSLTADAGQCVENLGIGTKQANARMELVNPCIAALIEENHLEALYLQAIPTWVEGYEKIRLLKKITYLIKDRANEDYQKCIRIDFDMLSFKTTCSSEIEPIITFLRSKFTSSDQTKAAAPLTPLYSKRSQSRLHRTQDSYVRTADEIKCKFRSSR